jgi:hypothetical protein
MESNPRECGALLRAKPSKGGDAELRSYGANFLRYASRAARENAGGPASHM